MAEIRNYTLNFGPQHPAAHGVLRLVLELDGEVIQRADPHIGLLHRATEKLAEHKTYIQSVPYMDRLDYVSMMCNEHAYVMAIEKLLGVEVPERCKYLRTIASEVSRMSDHFTCLGACALELGAFTAFLYGVEAREHVWDIHFDSISNVVEVHINSLRNKVDRGFTLELIHTVRGVGYVLRETPP